MIDNTQFRHCKILMYADDTVLYTSASSLEAAFANLQADFISLQHSLFDAKLVLNANKTKIMFFRGNIISPNRHISELCYR